MKERHYKGRYDAAAIHDGQSWRLVLLGGTSALTFASPADRLPQDLVDAACAARVRRLLFLISAGVHVIDGSIPKSAGMARVTEQLRLAISESTGVDSDDAIVSGMTTSWPGTRKPFTVASRFDGAAAADFQSTLAEAGIGCAGFASLELALLASWRKKVVGRQAFVELSSGHAFIVPPPRGSNPGPQTVACGLRHFAMDAGNWLTRFQRSSATVEKDNPLHLLVLDAQERFCADGISAALADAGYANVVMEPCDAWLEDAVRAAYASKPNRCRGVSVPVANPWEPHKRFSAIWLVAAAALIMALPTGYKTLCERQSRERCGAVAREVAALRPKADKVRTAQRALAQARADAANAKAAGRARVDMRRPLVAFIDIAHLFCKNAGNSIVLDSIRQDGEKISVAGSFSDPEDGFRLGKVVDSYVKGTKFTVMKNEVNPDKDGDGSAVNGFTLEFDCSNVGRE